MGLVVVRGTSAMTRHDPSMIQCDDFLYESKTRR
jgi:hypothetical protein